MKNGYVTNSLSAFAPPHEELIFETQTLRSLSELEWCSNPIYMSDIIEKQKFGSESYILKNFVSSLDAQKNTIEQEYFDDRKGLTDVVDILSTLEHLQVPGSHTDVLSREGQ